MFRSSIDRLKALSRPRDRLRRRGEGLMAMALGLAVLAGVAQVNVVLMRELANDVKIQATADQARRMANAVSNFVVANQSTLLAETGGVGGVTSRTFTQLQAAGVAPVPASFSNSNAFRQGYVLIVSQPTAGTLLPILRTYGPVGSGRIPNGSAMAIAQRIGAAGGFIENQFLQNPALMTGTGGGWSVSRASFAALDGTLQAALGATNWLGASGNENGTLAINLGLSEVSSTSNNWLARVDVGNVELNTMRTNLLIAGGANINMAATGTVGASVLNMNQNGSNPNTATINMNESNIANANQVNTQEVANRTSGNLMSNAVQRTFIAIPNQVVPKTTIDCARGANLAALTPRIDVAPMSLQDSSGRIWSAQDVYVNDLGASWQVIAQLLVPNGAGGTIWVDASTTLSRVLVALRCT